MQCRTFIFVLCGLLIFSSLLLLKASAIESEDEHVWRSTVTQSNESWPVIISYETKETFFQDDFLELNLIKSNFSFINESLNNISITLNVKDGFIDGTEEKYPKYYRWYRWDSELKNDFLNALKMYYCLKPKENNNNFEMTLTIEIQNKTTNIYQEQHVFWIIGDPIIIPGEDYNEIVDLNQIFIQSLLISVIFLITIYLIYHLVELDKKRKKK